MATTLHKTIQAATQNLGNGEIFAIVSTESVDRDGDIIRQQYWDLTNFNRHPILLSSHDYSSLQNQIGTWRDVKVQGNRLQGVAKYHVGQGNAEADWAHFLATEGESAYSVGFRPDMDKAQPLKGRKGTEFKGQELLEISHVSVPSNADALQQRLQGLKDPTARALYRKVLQGRGIEPPEEFSIPDLISGKYKDKEPWMPPWMRGE